MEFHLDKRAAKIAETMEGDDDDLLKTREAGAAAGMSVPWMEARRLDGNGPPFIRLSSGAIRYRRGDLREWIRSRARHYSTREYSGRAA